MITREQFERFQMVLRSAYGDLATKRFLEGPPDAYFWTTLRERLDRAGATVEDRRRIAASFIRWMASEGDCDTVGPISSSSPNISSARRWRSALTVPAASHMSRVGVLTTSIEL
jgi:hypothetical protein